MSLRVTNMSCFQKKLLSFSWSLSQSWLFKHHGPKWSGFSILPHSETDQSLLLLLMATQCRSWHSVLHTLPGWVHQISQRPLRISRMNHSLVPRLTALQAGSSEVVILRVQPFQFTSSASFHNLSPWFGMGTSISQLMDIFFMNPHLQNPPDNGGPHSVLLWEETFLDEASKGCFPSNFNSEVLAPTFLERGSNSNIIFGPFSH